MSTDLNALKKSLSELAPIVNEFKAEAVQIRVFEILLSILNIDGTPIANTTNDSGVPTTPIGRRARKKTAAKKAGKKKVSGGSGPWATLNAIYDAGYFSQSRTISDIIAHCETKMAKRIKSNEISSKLAGMVRAGQLSRSKNTNGQYEYVKS